MRITQKKTETTFKKVGVNPIATGNRPGEKTFIIETSKVPAYKGLLERIKAALPEITHEGETYRFSKFVRGSQSNLHRFHVRYALAN